jgi:hypothetical protein
MDDLEQLVVFAANAHNPREPAFRGRQGRGPLRALR